MGAALANQDSFITEVTDEVRRDRLFALMRRYGGVAVLAIVVVVGGAAFNEWRKARAQAAAEAFGDAVLAAMSEESAEDRRAALAELSAGDSPERRALLALLAAASEAEADDGAAAVASLRAVAADPEVPELYRDIALFKSVVVSDGMAPQERIDALQPIVAAGHPLRLIALEQRALAEVELGDAEAALATLKGIVADAGVTEDLRQRASQLIVALGGSIDQV